MDRALIQNIARIVNVWGNILESLKTMLSLPMAFVKMTLTMTNAIMTALIAALHPVIRNFAFNVIVKVHNSKQLQISLDHFTFD